MRRGIDVLYLRSRPSSEMAAQAFSRLLALPPSAAGHRLQAEIVRLHNRHAGVVKEWREALKLSPGNAAIDVELGRSLRANQDYQGAARVLSGLLARQPDSAECIIRWARACRRFRRRSARFRFSRRRCGAIRRIARCGRTRDGRICRR